MVKTELDVSIKLSIRRSKSLTTITATIYGSSGELLNFPTGHTYELTEPLDAINDVLESVAINVDRHLKMTTSEQIQLTADFT